MNEVELILLTEGSKCTLYTIQFVGEDSSEFQKFYQKFIDNAKLNADLLRIVEIMGKIAEKGALERLFRPESKMRDSVMALPIIPSKLRLYCLRLSEGILILGNGDVKNSRTYQENDNLKGHVLTLQKFEELLKEGIQKGSVTISERKIETDQTFEL